MLKRRIRALGRLVGSTGTGDYRNLIYEWNVEDSTRLYSLAVARVHSMKKTTMNYKSLVIFRPHLISAPTNYAKF